MKKIISGKNRYAIDWTDLLSYNNLVRPEKNVSEDLL